MRVAGLVGTVYRIVLAAFALLGMTCALSYQSWKPVLAAYSTSYLFGVLLPLFALAALQVRLSLRLAPAPRAPRSVARRQSASVLGVAVLLGAAWAMWVPEPRTRIFVVLWLPALALLALYRRLGWIELVLAGIGPLALAMTIFVGELPMHPMLPVVNWGDATTLEYLFPVREPYFGRGGRLRPNLRGRLRSDDYPGGALLVTNGDGFRNAETSPQRPAPSEHRLLSLGDSFSCGYGANQGAFFGPILGRRLRSATEDREITVLSAEVSDPAYGLYYLQKYGLSFEPRLVIYGLSANDVMQSAQFAGQERRFRFRDDGLLEPNPSYANPEKQPPADTDNLVSEMRGWVYPKVCPSSSLHALRTSPPRDSRESLLSALRTFRWLADLWSFGVKPAKVMPSFAAAFEASDGHKRLIDGYANLGHYYLRDSEQTRRINAAVRPLLRGFKQACERVGARFLLVHLPQRYQVAPADWEVMRSFWNLDPADFDLSLFNRELAEFCAVEEIECLDLLVAFREAGRTKSLYLPDGDMHFNARGHELAGRVTADFIARHRLMAQPDRPVRGVSP